MNGRSLIVLGALLASAGVALGAIGAHVLRSRLSDSQFENFEVAVRYQMYHALGLVLVGILRERLPSRWLSAAGYAFLLGIVLFSGGLYAYLATDVKAFVHIVPIGGTAWIVGWILLAVAALRGAKC